MSAFKTKLSAEKDVANAVVKMTKTESVLELVFEDGTNVGVDPDEIEDIKTDSVSWLINFYFSDGSLADSYMVGTLNITNDMIQVNPYSLSPLTAVAKLNMPIKGRFNVIVHGKATKGMSIKKNFSTYTTTHELPILGLYQAYNNQVEFIFTNQNGVVRGSKILTITTAALGTTPSLEINKSSLSSEYHGLYIVADLLMGFDQTGEVRWAYTGDASQFYHKLANGNFSVSSSDNTAFYEVTPIGQVIKKYAVPNGLHHEIKEMPNGNFLVGTSAGNGVTLQDMVIEVSRTTGSIVKSWDFNKILDPTRTTLPIGSSYDWLHLNCVYYDDTDKSIVISSRHQSAVVKLDYETGQVRWILGNHAFWNADLSQYLLTPIDSLGRTLDASQSDFWPYGQHAPQQLENGDIFLYDNGDYRGYYDNPNAPYQSYTRAVEYRVDEQAKTVQLIWQFTNNKSVFTIATGYVDHLKDTGTRLIAYMYGSANTPKIVEIDGNNKILFDANVNTGANYYRALKVDFYDGIQ